MEFKNNIDNNQVTLFIDEKLYSKDGIFKCMYWYSSKFHTNISLENSEIYKISISPKSQETLSPLELENIMHNLERDLIDYNLRDIVSKETQNIRDLLIAKAFSNGEFDELPPGEVNDPVGFNII